MKISRIFCSLVLVASLLSVLAPPELTGRCDYYRDDECPWSELEWEKVDTKCNFDWDCWFIFQCKSEIYEEKSTGYRLICDRGCACIFGRP